MMAIDGDQRVLAVLVDRSMTASACFSPVTVSERHTSVAWAPSYQPMRNAVTVKLGATVETYRRTVSPGEMLTLSAQPSMS